MSSPTRSRDFPRSQTAFDARTRRLHLTASAGGVKIRETVGHRRRAPEMASVNKVILIGNLGRDPELRYTQSGQAVANFTLATTERFSNREGERQERTEWHRIVAWGRTAELCAQYLAKGRSVYIEGRLQTREWEDKEGQKRRTTEITAHTVQFLGARGGPGSPAGSDPGPSFDEGGNGGAGSAPPPQDDIPF
jgi:single-strand DNA-binding protein